MAPTAQIDEVDISSAYPAAMQQLPYRRADYSRVEVHPSFIQAVKESRPEYAAMSSAAIVRIALARLTGNLPPQGSNTSA